MGASPGKRTRPTNHLEGVRLGSTVTLSTAPTNYAGHRAEAYRPRQRPHHPPLPHVAVDAPPAWARMLSTGLVGLMAGLVKPSTLTWKGSRGIIFPENPARAVTASTAPGATRGGGVGLASTPETGMDHRSPADSIHRSAWKVNSANFALAEFSRVDLSRVSHEGASCCGAWHHRCVGPCLERSRTHEHLPHQDRASHRRF